MPCSLPLAFLVAGSPAPLTRLLSGGDISAAMIVLGLASAFALGAVHALSPGHGKALVATYLVGSRGTLRHAALLGATVTFTHTVSVFLLGVATLFLSAYVVPDRVYPVLGAISGLSIVAIGLSLFVRRLHKLRRGHHHNHHHHHVPPEEITMGSLVALGVSGGLVPCPSAMVLLLTAISLRRTGTGLILLVAFSLGLALVLFAIGTAAIYAQNLLPRQAKLPGHPVWRFLPVTSAGAVTLIGVVMTAVALGWIKVPGAG